MSTTQTDEITNSLDVIVYPEHESQGWQVGAIDPGKLTDESIQQLVDAVIAAIQPVDDGQLPYSDCTDGRLRTGLVDGSTEVPLREKLVGADSILGFVMAEALGPNFYADPSAPITDRLRQVLSFMNQSGLQVCTHEGCGAAGGLVAVLSNIITFAHDPNFVARLKRYVPAYDKALYDKMIDNLGDKLATDVYEGYTADLVTQIVIELSGEQAVAKYRNDGRGQSGHLEALIVRLLGIEGYTVDANKLAALTHDEQQVFVVNDSRMQRLAQLFGRGNDADYAVAYLAGEAFTSAGHGTLGHGLLTVDIRAKA